MAMPEVNQHAGAGSSRDDDGRPLEQRDPLQLNISAHTVKFHISSILGKLGASTRTEAAAIGLRRGLIMI